MNSEEVLAEGEVEVVALDNPNLHANCVLNLATLLLYVSIDLTNSFQGHNTMLVGLQDQIIQLAVGVIKGDPLPT